MLLWKGIDFRAKGIIVEHVPTISKGKKNITTYQVEGRNGFLAVDSGTYQPWVLTVNCHFNTDSADFDEIKEYLDGFGTLSFDGEKEYTAIIDNSIDFEKVAQAHFRRFPVQFLVNPIAESLTATSVTISASPQTITIANATAEMFPTLTINGSGNVDITINNKTFYLTDLVSTMTYTLDCKNKVIVNNNGINCSSQMLYDFPSLKPGNNTVEYTGTVSSFVITYKEAYL